MTGDDWILRHGYLHRLERIAAEVAADWGLALGARITSGRFSYVAPAGEDAILKVVPAEDDDADHIAEALRFWDGDGAVRLLRYDRARRALLLERVRPGTEAATLDEDRSTAVAIAVGRRIWRRPLPGHPFRPVSHWIKRWMPSDDVHPLVPVARRVYETMTPSFDRVVHTDFHHYNLLQRGEEWVVIDPKPYIGEPEFDIISFLVNPDGAEPTRARTERRIRAFADAGLDGDRIRRWSIVRGILDGLSGPGEGETRRMRVARMLL